MCIWRKKKPNVEKNRKKKYFRIFEKQIEVESRKS